VASPLPHRLIFPLTVYGLIVLVIAEVVEDVIRAEILTLISVLHGVDLNPRLLFDSPLGY